MNCLRCDRSAHPDKSNAYLIEQLFTSGAVSLDGKWTRDATDAELLAFGVPAQFGYPPGDAA